MKKLAFLLVATLVMNLAAPAATTYALPVNGAMENIQEIAIEETAQENNDVEILSLSGNEESKDVASLSEKEEDCEDSVLSEMIESNEFTEEQGKLVYKESGVNPLYADVVSEEELETDSDVLETMAEVRAKSVTTKKEVIDYMRQQMVARANTIVVSMPLSLYTDSYVFQNFFLEAIEHYEGCSGQEGDALYWCWKEYGIDVEIADGKMKVTYSLVYLTDAQQEMELTEKVNEIMSGFGFTDSIGEYDKVKAIHDYICDNVNYDSTYTKYSAYDALCTGTSVCEGYAVAFYRLAKEAGLSVRVVAGIGQNESHGWNIVKIGDVYYNIDCTWDGQDQETVYDWFLLNEIDFVSHTRDNIFTTDEFYETYPMAEFSYGKTTVSTLNLSNFNYTYQTIEDTQVSGAAGGNPKVLIFFNTGCRNSQYTINDLVKYDLGGVDIFAIDAQKNTKENVQEFKENYGDDTIRFCYDTGSGNNTALWSYARAGGFNGSISYPLICYIDGNNKLQYVTSGVSNGRQICNYLKLTCGYEQQYREYSITYHLDSGTNHAENPAVFYAMTDTITLKEASKSGYAFYGWYTEPEFVNKVTKIEKGTRGNITLYAKFVKELELTVPEKTTYFVGEKMDPTGGRVVHNASEKSADISSSMISGFDSTKEGICTVTVTYQKCKTTFDVLIVNVPEFEAEYGQTLHAVSIPESSYGTFRWTEGNTVLNQVGKNICALSFQPKDTKFSIRDDVKGTVSVYRSVAGEGITYEVIKNADLVYNGYPHKPEIVVYDDGVRLTAQDYHIRYGENTNAGLGYFWIEGQNYYTGSRSDSFTIEKAKLTILAKDVFLEKGSVLPSHWEYEVQGLAKGDNKGDIIVTEPSFSVPVRDTNTTGIYPISIYGGAVTGNYDGENIHYVGGELRIAEEKVGYSVIFDLQGRGENQKSFGIKAGNVIEEPETPTAAGYEFGGWYKDANYKNPWNFATDTVQSDVVLYGKWMEVKEGFRINEIKDVVYTGKKLQPAVEVYDGETLLKAKKDYKITYHNNINVNQTEAGDIFDESLPYVSITGVGNYADTVKLNFDILPEVIGDGSDVPATGVVVSYTDQLKSDSKKSQNPLKSVKLGRNLKKDTDYTVSLSAVEAKNASGELLTGTMADGLIPAGSSGTFRLVITGQGNYAGSIVKTIYVAAKNQLLSQAKITLGKNLKSVDLIKYKEESGLPAAYYDAATKKYYAVENGSVNYEKEVDGKEVFVVKSGNTGLVYQKDFVVEYQKDDQVGKATLVIIGKGSYYGSKTATFNLTGKAFNAKKVSVRGVENKTYTGKPITQNGVQVIYNDGSPAGALLKYGTDYTISYTNHINKGKATMIITAKADSGYTGTIKQTFQIEAADLNSVLQKDMDNITVEYDKAGAKPVDEIQLINENGIPLVNGKDYTLSYENNKNVADKNQEKAPTIVVKGKGNYTGTPLRIPFTIKKAVLNIENVKIEVKEMAYNAKKPATYEYKPAVKIYAGNKVLSVNKDYKIEYQNHTQEAYQAYIFQNSGEAQMPKVVITEAENSNYEINGAMEEELPIYQTKFTSGNLYAVCEGGEYTGEQVSTATAVYYTDDKNLMKQAKQLTKEEEILALGLVKLKEGKDYSVSYGKNVAAGRNKGTVTVKGISPVYGGSVTFKFTIENKKIRW